MYKDIYSRCYFNFIFYIFMSDFSLSSSDNFHYQKIQARQYPNRLYTTIQFSNPSFKNLLHTDNKNGNILDN